MNAKRIKALREKKNRQSTGRFLVEGRKTILELLKSDYHIEAIYGTKDFKGMVLQKVTDTEIFHTVEESELAALGTLEHNDGAIAIVHQKELVPPNVTHGVTLVLDDIRDPGNLGTIIRIADWYGIKNIVCSPTCVDWYNPKVIAASMGSFTRVSGYYTDLAGFIKRAGVPAFGAFLDGASVYDFALPEAGLLVIGSESHGISKDVERQITKRITIPARGGAESLNAAVATAVLLDNWTRKF
jgi:TrmH family RNA methyltransferase